MRLYRVDDASRRGEGSESSDASRSSQRVVLENHGCRGDEVVTGRGEDSWVGLEAEAWRGEAWIVELRVEVSR